MNLQEVGLHGYLSISSFILAVLYLSNLDSIHPYILLGLLVLHLYMFVVMGSWDFIRTTYNRCQGYKIYELVPLEKSQAKYKYRTTERSKSSYSNFVHLKYFIKKYPTQNIIDNFSKRSSLAVKPSQYLLSKVSQEDKKSTKLRQTVSFRPYPYVLKTKELPKQPINYELYSQKKAYLDNFKKTLKLFKLDYSDYAKKLIVFKKMLAKMVGRLLTELKGNIDTLDYLLNRNFNKRLKEALTEDISYFKADETRQDKNIVQLEDVRVLVDEVFAKGKTTWTWGGHVPERSKEQVLKQIITIWEGMNNIDDCLLHVDNKNATIDRYDVIQRLRFIERKLRGSQDFKHAIPIQHIEDAYILIKVFEGYYNLAARRIGIPTMQPIRYWHIMLLEDNCDIIFFMSRDIWGNIQLDVGCDQEIYYTDPSENKVYCAVMMYLLLLRQKRGHSENYKPMLSYFESFLQ